MATRRDVSINAAPCVPLQDYPCAYPHPGPFVMGLRLVLSSAQSVRALVLVLVRALVRGDGLGEVAGHVRVDAAQDGEFVRDELRLR
jgi:hypothetical protein